MVSNIILSAAAWASSLRSTLMQRVKDENGQDLLEYAVLTGAIAVVAGGLLFGMNPGAFTTMRDKIEACIGMNAGGCN